ncbi:nuclear condensing complex subunit [Rhodocollybia butyracea]|uniref:Nuclear condensing complex subunit n=1 Tax=Rhodocollybia butyracea TaxID=206335 RepID=A0A9P5UEK5_9AGAR|nr:nuclear condensing complex subunit [Rhodocollybia butyracea]
MPGRTVAKPRPSNSAILEELSPKISAIFDQVQNTLANHQKNIVALHKIYIQIAQIRGKTRDGAAILTGEKHFEQVTYSILLRLLESKKGGPGDRVVRFFAGFVKYINEKSGEDSVDEDDIDEHDVAYPPAARFTERLVCKLLVKGFDAKEKLVRYRAVQIAAELVFILGEIDNTIYYELRAKLLDRIHDKEQAIRSQASIALCKFYGIDDEEELKERKLEPLSVVLFESLSYDPQAEVRQAIINNIPVNKVTVPHILERTRDIDPKTRKMVYKVLENHVTSGDEDEIEMGFTHPRALSIEQRESIVRNGLGDRNNSVRDAAAKLIEKWVETADLRPDSKEGDQEEKDELGLLGLLKMFDLRADEIVGEAIIRIFEANPHILDGINFGDTFWASLTPETVFLARICVQFCESDKSNDKKIEKLEAILPVVTSFAFRLQENFNALVDTIRSKDQEIADLDDEARAVRQDDVDNKQFVVSEMLKIAISLDYGDEIGRRKMDSLIRDIITHDFLPEELVAPTMAVMRRLAGSEKDLIRVIAIEVVPELQDPGDNDDDDERDVDPDASFDSTDTPSTPARVRKPATKEREDMTEAERVHADKIDRRCLCICESMLERVNGTLDTHSSLDAIVTKLIYPAVRRKDGDSREQGLRCLGLISLLSRPLAQNALAFFVKQMLDERNPEELRIIAIQAIFDILMLYDQGIMVEPFDVAFWVQQFTAWLEQENSTEDIRAVLCMGLAKLMLPGVLVDGKIMEVLLTQYFAPRNANNQKLKQCLSFFFQAYCAASIENQKMISTIFIRIYCNLCRTSDTLEDDEEMASMGQISGMILEWTSPNTLYVDKDRDEEEKGKDSRLHFDIAMDICKELLNKDSELDKNHKKVLCQHLFKLSLPEDVDEDAVRYLSLVIDKVPSCRPFADTASKNAFLKFQTAFAKKYEKCLEGLSVDEFLAHEKHQEEAQFLNEIIPEDEPVQLVKRGRKRRSGSITSSVADDEPTKKGAKSRKGRTKRARLSTSDGSDASDDDDGTTEQGTPQPSSHRQSAAPTRTMPKRQATRKRQVEIIAISSDSDEDEGDDATPRDRRPRPSASNVKREDEQDPHMTIIHDDGDSDEEDEVTDLLAQE